MSAVESLSELKVENERLKELLVSTRSQTESFLQEKEAAVAAVNRSTQMMAEANETMERFIKYTAALVVAGNALERVMLATGLSAGTAERDAWRKLAQKRTPQ